MAIPALLTGAPQVLQMYSSGQAFEADKKTLKPKFTLTLCHAALSDIALAATTYSWYIRRDQVGFLPTDLNLAISATVLPVLMFGLKLGGALVFEHGMGVNLAKKGKKN
jgi:hypothetical protein